MFIGHRFKYINFLFIKKLGKIVFLFTLLIAIM